MTSTTYTRTAGGLPPETVTVNSPDGPVLNANGQIVEPVLSGEDAELTGMRPPPDPNHPTNW